MISEDYAKELKAARKRIQKMDEHDGGMVCDPGTIMAALAYGIGTKKRMNMDGLFDAYVMLEQARRIEAFNKGWLKRATSTGELN